MLSILAPPPAAGRRGPCMECQRDRGIDLTQQTIRDSELQPFGIGTIEQQSEHEGRDGGKIKGEIEVVDSRRRRLLGEVDELTQQTYTDTAHGVTATSSLHKVSGVCGDDVHLGVVSVVWCSDLGGNWWGPVSPLPSPRCPQLSSSLRSHRSRHLHGLAFLAQSSFVVSPRLTW